MEKTLEILERNVQWIALGLGVLFLAWVAYAYVVTPPAVVKLPNNGTVGPGEVAMITRNGPVHKFERENGRKDPADFATPDIVSSWRGQMDRPLGLPIEAFAFDGLTSGGIQTGIVDHALNIVRLTALPVLPEARPLTPVAGMSMVNVPAKAPNPNARQQVALATQKDIVWDTTAFKIPAALLTKAFKDVLNGQPAPPPAVYNTTLLQVVLERQESTGVDANGQPAFPADDKFQTIPWLSIHKDEFQPLPKETAALPEKYQYLAWAQKDPDLIAKPAFYETPGGTVWAPPQDAANAAGADTQPAAAPAGAPDAGGITPQSAAPRQPDDSGAARLAAYEQPGRPDYRRGYNRGRGNPRFNGQFNAPNQFNGNGAQGQAVIDPLNLQDDIEVWCHDETVKPGKTYRYRIVYQMKNPVFGIENMADAKLVQTLALASPPSKWSDPVTIPEMTKFWLARQDSDKARFDVFHWVAGNWKALKVPPLAPGDLVPDTEWSVVDLRHGSHNDSYVLLTSDTGEMSRRSPNIDGADDKYTAMKEETNPNNAGQGGNGPASPPPQNLRPRRGGPPQGRGGRSAYGGR